MSHFLCFPYARPKNWIKNRTSSGPRLWWISTNKLENHSLENTDVIPSFGSLNQFVSSITDYRTQKWKTLYYCETIFLVLFHYCLDRNVILTYEKQLIFFFHFWHGKLSGPTLRWFIPGYEGKPLPYWNQRITFEAPKIVQNYMSINILGYSVSKGMPLRLL